MMRFDGAEKIIKPLQGSSDSKRKEVLSSGFLMMGGEVGQ
jgi:hypothetical protein